jgi:hypothetical protein
MNRMNLKYGLVALAGLGISANVSATDLTCSDITFTPEAYAAYEFVDKACLEMVDRDGGTYAKMTAKVVAQTGSGTHLRYRHADGELGPSHKSNAPEDFQTRLAGQPVKVKDLAVRQDINIYVSDAYWALPPVEVAAAAAPPPPPPAPEPEPEPEPEVLPTTASSLPLLALFGSLFLLLGGALRLSRKQ